MEETRVLLLASKALKKLTVYIWILIKRESEMQEIDSTSTDSCSLDKLHF